MKIAVFHDLPSGGAKRALFEQVRRLADRHLIDVYSLNTADHEFCDLRPYVNHHRVFNLQVFPLFHSPFGRANQVQRWRTLIQLEKLSMQIAEAIDREGYDLVFVHPCMWTQAPVFLKYLETVSIYYVHEPLRNIYEPEIPRPYKSQGWQKKIDKVDPFIKLYQTRLASLDSQSTSKATHLVTNSIYTAANIKRFYQRDANVVYLGVDDHIFHPIPGIRKERFVLSVGAVGPHKGFDFLIHSLACLAADQRPQLHIIGNADDQNERQYLMQLARENGVDLSIETKVTIEALVNKYNQALFVVYGAVREPFGLVPLEAMACETPVICVKEGGVCETVVDGVTGRLVPREPQLFADAVRDLLAKPDLTVEMGRKGREWVCQAWTWEKSITETEKFFTTITGAPSHADAS